MNYIKTIFNIKNKYLKIINKFLIYTNIQYLKKKFDLFFLILHTIKKQLNKEKNKYNQL